jgi:hypothetical protein
MKPGQREHVNEVEGGVLGQRQPGKQASMAWQLARKLLVLPCQLCYDSTLV